MLNRAYSLLTVKSVDDGKRIITGIASTPEPDRVGDIVEPVGAEFKNPSPLLWMHMHDLPVGTVNFGKPTKAGIPFEATIARVEEPAGLKARLDEAWQSVKAGIVAAVSIGFKPIEYSFLEDTGGIRFSRIDIMELSLVTVPANAGATITAIKSIDNRAMAAAFGNAMTDKHAFNPQPTAVGATQVKLQSKKETMMNIAEQIKQFEAERVLKSTEMQTLMEKSANAGETLSGADGEAYDALDGEVKSIDTHLARLKRLQDAQMTNARPVETKAAPVVDADAAAAARNTNAGARSVSVRNQDDNGIAFARMVKCMGLAGGNLMQAHQIAETNYKSTSPRVVNALKAAVSAGSTSNATWAGNLVGDESSVYADFVDFLRPQTILGRFGSNGIPALRRVPFRVRLGSQTSGGAGYWTGEGAAKGLMQLDFAATTLEPLKVANIAVITEELLRDSSPSADVLVRDGLVDALRERLDIDFIDPAKAAVNGVSPASITRGVTAIPSSGSSAENVRCDIEKLLSTYIVADNPPENAVIIMSSVSALGISLMRNALGQREFSELTMKGGFLEGIPVITSQYVPTDSAGSIIVMVNASDIWFGDDGGFRVDLSREASLQMDNAPTMNSTTPTGVNNIVSMFQTNSVAFRAERTLNWAKRRNSAVAVLEGVNYSACVS